MNETLLQGVLLAIATKFSGETSAHYGATVNDDKFSMSPYCYCEKDDCPQCGENAQPNFLYKPTGFSVSWYKYIGRGMKFDEISDEQIAEMFYDIMCKS